MRQILLTGVGGQGTVLAAKVLAQAALAKGWPVRTAETIGMAQRGGSVVSHVRIGTEGEPVHSPLIGGGQADLVIAFEPGEAVRVLPYLASGGALVTAETAIQPVTAALSKTPYRSADACNCLRARFGEGAAPSTVMASQATAAAYASAKPQANVDVSRETPFVEPSRLVLVDDDPLCEALGTRKALNMVLLGRAARAGLLPFTAEELEGAMECLVKPRFVDLNRRALAS